VGRYTAGAISSIAFGAREPIVDGNVFRVLARLAGRRAPATDGAAMRATWREAEALVRAARIPGVANEALMELGATVCTPAAPRCAECPLRRMCRARATGAPQAIPAAKPRAERTTVHWHALVVVRRGAVLLEPRGERGLWARMWQVPTIEDAAPLAPAALATRWGVPCRRVAEFEHATTHRRLRFSVHVPSSPARGRAGTPDPSARATSARWVALSRIAEYPLANAMRRVLAAAGAEVSPPLVAAASPRTRRGSPSAATDS
jgi:A/G-specific adenine glycosylase